ncbi:hydroxymethylglutaryl-CoA lyase [Glaciecola sp.]|jgi:hydroxymethylglutaryl-CoA lyase|nr:hydroxymethylglutaryl-CoA lyase [Glaciecola sp.]
MTNAVSIVEVGPRDGLQNEATSLTTNAKVQFIEALAQAGCKRIEVGSFVSSKWVPQMANSDEVLTQIHRKLGVTYSALTPNMQGVIQAIASGADEVAIFGAASEAFTQKNINCSIAESINRFTPVIAYAKAHSIPVRGYVSTVMGCPYSGNVPLKDVVNIAAQLYQLGCYEISLGDTIGVGSPRQTNTLITAVSDVVPIANLAVHFHNTYGQALANVLTAINAGVRIVDTSAAGLGGCPYAHGASGNLATEDLVYMLNGMGMATGIDLPALIAASKPILQTLNIRPASAVNIAMSQ